MRVRILSRASALARLQARLVGRALQGACCALDVEYLERRSAGDADQVTALDAFADKGAFTADLSAAVASGAADLVVHSWKDLPIEERADTTVAGTLERADPRDVLLLRSDIVEARPPRVTLFSSSPRRAWLVAEAVPALLPWRTSIEMAPVRGNIPTRLSKLLNGGADGLVVAKAALDRLLAADDGDWAVTARTVREALDRCRWMVLPIREVPAAPAQGALAIEVARSSTRLRELVAEITHAPTWRAVQRERELLAAHGGGCHAAFGATLLPRPYGDVLSLRARQSSGDRAVWELRSVRPRIERASIDNVWPLPRDRARRLRWPLDVAQPALDAVWVTRAEALPRNWSLDATHVVWAAGTRTWRTLAARAVWVNGCAEGLGDSEPADVERLAGRRLTWRRLTHRASGIADGLATYHVDNALPADLPRRSHFFWTSGSELREALTRWPELADRWHACGPGRTSLVMSRELVNSERCGVWLDYDDWLREVTGQ